MTLTTKLKRSQALEYSFDKLAGFDFEAYGVEDYLNSFYSKGNSISELKENIANSGEQEIFSALPSQMILATRRSTILQSC